jgi:hypothetical protein
VRTRARTLLVALALATVATALTATPAHAVEVKQQTHLVAQFSSGHTGWVKIALEKDPSNNKARAHLAIWCQNASGTQVNCGSYGFKANASWLRVEYWSETAGWQYVVILPLCGTPTDCDYPASGIDNKWTGWECTGQGSDQYRASIENVRIKDAFGQMSGWKTRTHPTWLGSFC